MNWTYSDREPKIQRLQGVILFPVDITSEVIEDENGKRTQYRYHLLRVKDVGQEVHQDRERWITENKALLNEYLYGDLETVVKAIEADMVADLKAEADQKLSVLKTDVKKEMK